MRYFLIAGETSGDLYASKLISAIKVLDKEASFEGFGGLKMKSEGVKLHFSIEKLSFMGFWEVVKNVSIITEAFKVAKNAIQRFQPDIVVLIDYPGFNMRMAKWAKQKGFKVIYYIAPQVWAWKPHRINKIRKYVNQLLVILPFEESYFRERGVEAHFVGHPMVECVEESKSEKKELIALFPGSRRQEVEIILPVMLEVTKACPQHTFGIACVPHLKEIYQSYIKEYNNVTLFENSTDLLQRSNAAIVKSGTATLEAALYGVPQVVVYKSGTISYHLAKWFIRVKFISLVNILLGRKVVDEWIQGEMTKERILASLKNLQIPEKRQRLEADYELLRKKLGTFKASETSAKIIVNFLKD